MARRFFKTADHSCSRDLQFCAHAPPIHPGETTMVGVESEIKGRPPSIVGHRCREMGRPRQGIVAYSDR